MSLDLDRVVIDTQNAFVSMEDNVSLENEKARFPSKSGVLADLLEGLGRLDPKTRKIEGVRINRVKSRIEEASTARRQALADALTNARLVAETIDITLPDRDVAKGSLCPVINTWERIVKILGSIGFDAADGPKIGSDWMNFTVLSNPNNHPTRSMQDTFYIDGRDSKDKLLLLRTHTSPMQVRYARTHVEEYKHLDRTPPIRVIAPGYTYRVDSDAAYSSMFHRVEGLWIADNISFADLEDMCIGFLRNFFERNDVQMRFHPSYFPFIEPSAEIDMTSGNGKWLEISGPGQVHPTVVRSMSLDPGCYIGFAFGSGLERLTMLRYGIDDLRLFFKDDVRLLRQFV